MIRPDEDDEDTPRELPGDIAARVGPAHEGGAQEPQEGAREAPAGRSASGEGHTHARGPSCVEQLATHLAAQHWDQRGEALSAIVARRYQGDDPPVPIPWTSVGRALSGLASDDTTSPMGWRPGAYFLTAGTGVGKSQFAMQASVHAATLGTPVLYLALELDDLGLYTRAASMLCGHTEDTRGTEWERTRWSELYNGRVARVPEGVRAELARLPFFPVEPDAHAWNYEDLDDTVAALRVAADARRDREGLPPLDGAPVFVVLDFLQLVGPSRGNRREELRERIGRAAYRARMVARNQRAVVLCLSSIPRAAYGATLVDPAGRLQVDQGERPKGEASAATLREGFDLVGLGKESGDVEFSADGVLVLCPHRETEPRPTWRRVDLCVAKLRAGAAGVWCPMEFDGARFRSADTTPVRAGSVSKQERPTDGPRGRRSNGYGPGRGYTPPQEPDEPTLE